MGRDLVTSKDRAVLGKCKVYRNYKLLTATLFWETKTIDDSVPLPNVYLSSTLVDTDRE